MNFISINKINIITDKYINKYEKYELHCFHYEVVVIYDTITVQIYIV